MPILDLKDQIARLPEQPGVYLYANAAGETIYVGKARVLRDRVRNYLGARGADPKTDALLDEVQALSFIVTDSVSEALALESNLIKQRSPKYNILLRDDKSYPYLQLTTGEAFPRLLVARRVEEDEHLYFGPFLPARLARRTIDLTHRLFGLRSCNETITGQRGRPCLEYDIKRCVAPCVASLCSADAYADAVAGARLLLEGKRDALVADLDQRMHAAAERESYEEAAHWRDAVRTVEAIRDRQQKMATAGLGDRDGFGVRLGPRGSAVVVFQMRGGRVVDRVELWSEGAPVAPAADGTRAAPASREREVIAAALSQFYAVHVPPAEVHVPEPLEDTAAVEEWLSSRAGRRVRIVVPKRGDKRSLLELATRNARVAYESRGRETPAGAFDALEALRLVLQLPATPRRIDCFDISTFQGSETVASMVVCEDGRMQPREYRKFRIRAGDEASLPAGATAQARAEAGPDSAGTARILDDFKSMRQVVLRRYRAVAERGGPMPDLIVIDGGKGQLAAAYAALTDVGLGGVVAIGLAKQEELVFTRDAVDAIAFPMDSPALRLLQRIRDEAHRFAVTYHRQARSSRDLRSALDAIAGIGPRRRNMLLKRFGSVAGVRRATREELTASVGAKAADAILNYFAH
ncbi:MAG: excinuclease ABC subunit UvrC [Vicinamibacteraceae bacterium]